jgi:hypothetical protein
MLSAYTVLCDTLGLESPEICNPSLQVGRFTYLVELLNPNHLSLNHPYDLEHERDDNDAKRIVPRTTHVQPSDALTQFKEWAERSRHLGIEQEGGEGRN